MVLRKKYPAVLVGMAVGDALGMPFERNTDEIHPLLADWNGEFLPGTHHQLPAGHWTDDTEMAVALSESLIDMRGFHPEKVAEKYLRWSQGTPHGMGGTTRKAMANLAAGQPWDKSGVSAIAPERVGNGTAMRCAPIGVVFNSRQSTSLSICLRADAIITHSDLEASAASQAVGFVVSTVINDLAPRGIHLLQCALAAALHDAPETLVSQALKRACELFEDRQTPETVIDTLGRRGSAAQTVATALYCAAYYPNKTNFMDALQEAVRGGGDTDTRGAITGAVLGALHGESGIPAQFLEGLHDRELLQRLDRELANLRVSA